MINFARKHLRFCPKTDKFIGFKNLNGMSKMLFPIIGVAAMIWILIRVVPKPSRLTYPCVRAAMPIASGFIGYIAMLILSGVAFLISKKTFRYYPVFFLGAFMVFAIGGSSFGDNYVEQQFSTAVVTPNDPFGIAKGIFPGRVVWVHNPDATNENCPVDTSSGWFLPANNNQTVIDGMVSTAIRNLTGETTDSAAWRAIFQYHNNTRGKGAINYSAGEKIFIKTNVVSGWSGNFNVSTLAKVKNNYYNVTETSPAMVLAVLRQLVNVVGVAQTDIYVGDPLRHIYKHCYDLWHAEFPDVHYLDYSYSTLGREKVVVSATAKISYSDRGAVLRNNTNYSPGTQPIYRDQLYTISENAEYIMNLPMLKGHLRAGITMFAKNNFGSHTRDGAPHLHNGLVAPWEDTASVNQPANRQGYGLYRVQVDIMAHSLLSKKNLVYLMDALWATDYELDKPLKWQMAPFNNDWMSSVFASFDNVAIESVGYDFLRSEFTVARGNCRTAVQMYGVDDYLHQAADSSNWPAGIEYDPDSTNTLFASLGVHEHWNNATDKEYTRNLGTGDGIELYTGIGSGIADNGRNLPGDFVLSQNFPNPFNPSTTISYYLPVEENVSIKIYNIAGQEIETLVRGKVSAGRHQFYWTAKNLPSGIYFCRMQAGRFSLTKKLIYQK